MISQSVLPTNQAAVAAISQANNEPSWMTELRLEALDLAGQLDLPALEKTRINRWPLEAFGEYKPSSSIASITALPEAVQQLFGEDAAQASLLVQRNSAAVYRQLAEELQSKGVVFTDLQSALHSHGDLIKKRFMKAVKPNENRLTALHAAMWSGGVFIHVPANVHVEIPLQAVFMTDDPSSSFAPHILIIAEANSSLTYVDNYISVGQDAPLIHNGISEVFVEAGAKVNYASVHQLSSAMTDLSYRRAVVAQDAKVFWVVGEMNNGNTMSDTSSILEGSGSSSDAKVICVGEGNQHLNITTRAVHVGRSSTSDMTTRAVMRDQSTAIINGVTKIEKGATDSFGEQTERILMLSPQARGDANPLLLIDENEVKAGHAASVGQVSEEHLHYLMSRGISREEATRLIVYGFLAPVVSQIPIEVLESRLREVVERKLGQ